MPQSHLAGIEDAVGIERLLRGLEDRHCLAMLARHERALGTAHQRGEPAGQIAARQLEVSRIGHALRRAEDLPSDVAAAIEAEAGVC